MKDKYKNIDNTNWGQYLLSREQIKTNYYLLRNAKIELEPLLDRFMLLSKYKDKHWFHKTMHMTRLEIDYEMYRLGKLIEHIEESILEYETELHWNAVAKEELHNSMKPFEGVNLKEIELIQPTLF